jgi:hypothetical protein
MRYDTDVAKALMKTYDIFKIPYSAPPTQETILGPYWPAYLFAGRGEKLDIPIVGGAAGYGSNAHAANEFYVIEGAGKIYGIAGAEKSIATFFYNYAQMAGSSPTPTTTN